MGTSDPRVRTIGLPTLTETISAATSGLDVRHASTDGRISLVEDWASTTKPVQQVAIDTIGDSYSPRHRLVNRDHVAALAQSDSTLPPIVLHRTTMRVIDGMHRLVAARLRGETQIPAKFFDGSDADAFTLAVHLNVTHGLPLTLDERRNAAQRVLASNPRMSDRSIGLIAGISNKTVAKLRQRSTEERPQVEHRVGRDGKVRPVTASDGRRRAAEIFAKNPQTSVREVARQAGISAGTARDVERRLAAEEFPLPGTSHAMSGPLTNASELEPDRLIISQAHGRTVSAAQRSRTADQGSMHTHGGGVADPKANARQGNPLLQRLTSDPAVRSSENGRILLRLLATAALAIETCHKVADEMPPHCAGTLAELARQNARQWQEIECQFKALSHPQRSRPLV